VAAEAEQVDAEAAVLDELTALWAMVVGEAQGSREQIHHHNCRERAVLRRSEAGDRP
jgi:hypothetical protein